MGVLDSILWKPLLEESAQVIVGALGSYTLGKIVSKLYDKNTFDGSIDLWKRGIMNQTIGEGDTVHIDGLISPYSQLFPGNPYDNAKRWNKLYEFDGKITNNELQTLEFSCGSDSALRLRNFNGESVVGIYHRYGFIGEGILGVVPTSLLRKKIPTFFEGKFCAARAIISGKLTKCPSQHGFVVQGIALKAGIPFREIDYKKLYYVQVNSIKLITKASNNTFSLLGTTWAVTEAAKSQYIVSYGYISDENEKKSCVSKIQTASSWKKARVYYDDIEAPSQDLSFSKNFIL